MARAARIAALPEPHFWMLTPAEVDRIILEALEERHAFDLPADQRNALLCSILANCHRDTKKQPQPFTLEDFLFQRAPKKEPRPADTARKAAGVMAAVGKINRSLAHNG